MFSSPENAGQRGRLEFNKRSSVQIASMMRTHQGNNGHTYTCITVIVLLLTAPTKPTEVLLQFWPQDKKLYYNLSPEEGKRVTRVDRKIELLPPIEI